MLAIFHQLSCQIERLADVIEEQSCLKSHECPATKQDLTDMEIRIMATLQDIIEAAVALSTASDGLSVKLDGLVAKVDAVVAALKNVTLPPAATAALAALKASAATAATAGDKVDAEVTKLDGELPTPAPAGV